MTVAHAATFEPQPTYAPANAAELPQPQDFRRLLQAGSRLYMHFARETSTTMGRDGGPTIRRHLRLYGEWRGTEMREAHVALGLPVNMETLNRCWDSASVFIVKDDLESKGDYKPNDVRYNVHECPAADVWRAEGFREWGHAYCDEFHQACASTYHPDGNVVIPINMMKGDDHCAFRWVMPEGGRTVETGAATPLGEKLARFYQAETPQQAGINAMIRTGRLLAGRYWTMARALNERHGPDDGCAVVRCFLRAWGRQRGELTRLADEAAGRPISVRNAILGLDLLPRFLWEIRDEDSDGERLVFTISWTPMDDAWQDLGATDIASIFWAESLPAYVQAYDPGLRVKFLQNRWNGAPETRILVSR